jgi:phosphatidylserine decarboxylase
MDDLLLTIKKAVLVPIHPAGWPFIGIFAVVALILSLIGDGLGFIGIALLAWCVYFFRNPQRTTPVREGLIVAPADGTVQMIVQADLPPELEEQGTRTRVSIFLNVFDVHVQRVPADGEIKKVVYHPGKFLNASLDKASTDNERSSVLMQLKEGAGTVAFVQIAGLVARRIICKLTAGQQVRAGELYGLIRFGSRVDIFLPEGVEPLVSVGQKMVGGETVIADVKSGEGARAGEIRG